ncbi:MAG: 16S rRNA (cytosine(967)-C(5))-methyltransferase RsmB [Thermaerobacter sp.]|nr:16S rRNA (cytosine(967)-C(5))-methyltransferase RsmB [Thermaerobacter sp.]
MPSTVTAAGVARDQALAALRRVRRGTPVSEAIAAAETMKSADRALTAQLVYGVLRHRRYLDAWMRPFQRGRLSPDIRDILRLALFQMGWLDRVPAYAAVHAAVEQAKVVQPRAAGLVNAVLRRAQSRPPDPDHLSLGERFSHPDWLVERWRARYGPRLVSILEADNRVPPLMLRVNLSRTTRNAVLEELANLGVAAEPSAYLPEAVRVQGSLWLEDLPAFRRGLATVQDESGMLVGWILDPKPGDRIIDMAAGVGGKALHVLERTDGAVRLTGLDVSKPRLALFSENLKRTGYHDRVELAHSAAEGYAAQHRSTYDRIILDAPCSGLGVLRRRVDGRWSKAPDDLRALSARQQELLRAAAELAKPSGGVIVYSTCSAEPEETIEVLERVGPDRLGLVREDVTPFLPHAALRDFVTDGMLTLAPGDLGMDGFFIARLRKD